MSEIKIEVDGAVHIFAVSQVAARATVAQLKILSDEHHSVTGPSLAKRIDEQDMEIERLRAELGNRHQIIVDQAGEIRSFRQEIERLIAELDAARFAIPQPQPTQPLPPPVYVPFYVQPYPPAWLWPPYTISCTTAGEIKVSL